MDNNDILIRLRYALNIRNTEMIKIFKLGGIELTEEMVRKLLIKLKDTYRYNDEVVSHGETEDKEERINCQNIMLESFLNGLIIYKRGKQETNADITPDTKPETEQSERAILKNKANLNNTLLKKVKIALSLTGEDMLDIFAEAGVIVTKGELSALLRREGHKNYKECGDKYARNFLKGLTKKYRGV